jgi:hypothetical protein
MGYLTTITFYNDGANLIQRYKEEVADAVHACMVHDKPLTKGIGHFVNCINSQQPRHADDHTIYVHMGNCVTEVNPYSPEFKDLMQRSPDFAKRLVDFLEQEVYHLKKQLKTVYGSKPE